MICAGGEHSKDICFGDEGAPLVCNGILHGLGSWGNGCGRPDSPGIYTKISSFRSWIDTTLHGMKEAHLESITNNNTPEKIDLI